MDLELHGAKTGIRNLKSRLQKLDQESLKSQEIIYSQDFNIAQLERRIARMQGEGSVKTCIKHNFLVENKDHLNFSIEIRK